MRFVRAGRCTAITAVVVTALFGFTSGVASGHYTKIFHGSDWAESDHSHLNVHDIECDGHGVVAEAYDRFGFFAVRDNTGCGGTGVHGDGTDIYLYRLCELSEGCTRWYST
jgi:hypothetical protein